MEHTVMELVENLREIHKLQTQTDPEQDRMILEAADQLEEIAKALSGDYRITPKQPPITTIRRNLISGRPKVAE